MTEVAIAMAILIGWILLICVMAEVVVRAMNIVFWTIMSLAFRFRAYRYRKQSRKEVK